MRNIIVIGASSGIGRELALQFLGKGDNLYLCARRASLLKELHQEYQNNSHCLPFDVANHEHAFKILSTIFTELKVVDLVIFCAGTGDLNPDLNFGMEKPAIDTNVTGFTRVADLCFNLFKRQGFGHLVVLTSVAGLRGGAAAPAYHASKAYQINYLEALRIKARKEHLSVCITDVRPGFVDTALAKGEGLFFVAPVAKAAKQIRKAIDKKKSVVYVTRRWSLIAWLFRRMPFSILSRF